MSHGEIVDGLSNNQCRWYNYVPGGNLDYSTKYLVSTWKNIRRDLESLFEFVEKHIEEKLEEKVECR
jgi:hypothetical protein